MIEDTIRQIIREELERLAERLPKATPPWPAVGPDGNQITVSVKEAAKLLGITVTQAYEMVNQGVIPSVPLGPRNTRVPVAGLLQLGMKQDDRPGAQSPHRYN